MEMVSCVFVVESFSSGRVQSFTDRFNHTVNSDSEEGNWPIPSMRRLPRILTPYSSYISESNLKKLNQLPSEARASKLPAVCLQCLGWGGS